MGFPNKRRMWSKAHGMNSTGGVLFGLPAVWIASSKGFKPWRWLFAFGFIGLATVINLPSARERGISAEIALARARRADALGARMARYCLALTLLMMLTMRVISFWL